MGTDPSRMEIEFEEEEQKAGRTAIEREAAVTRSNECRAQLQVVKNAKKEKIKRGKKTTATTKKNTKNEKRALFTFASSIVHSKKYIAEH